MLIISPTSIMSMSKVILQDRVIFRVPRFSYEETLADNWEELKNLIAYSSPEFNKLIKEMSFEDLAYAPQKVQMTVRKYFNRARYRSTPYGGFATVGIGNFDLGKGGIVELEKSILPHAFVDWKITEQIQKDHFDTDTSFFANTTFYRVQDEIRFLQKNESGFQASAIDFDEVIWELLEFCNPPKRLDQIVSRFPDFDEQELTALISDLVGLQLFLTSYHPNIIGREYFTRIGIKTEPATKQYLIAERKIREGKFDKSVFRYIPELIQYLQKIRNTDQSLDLRAFRNDFIRRYEQAEIPLLEAIDPETGIGYGNFTSQVNSSGLTLIAGKQGDEESSKENALRDALYAEILAQCQTGKAIALENLISGNAKMAPLPNSLTVLCNVIDETVFLDFVGGASVTAISGRFALAIPEIEQYCKDVASLEQQANPGVLFFDIGYTNETSVDNVNRRPAIYDKQLNILNYDTSVQPLSVNDILVSIRDGQVVLRSRTLGMRLIPRMSTMYNYKRSDLSLFRLLLDIQFQAIASDLIPRLSDILPGLSYYPRVQFRNIIVCPATWQIMDTIFETESGKIAKHAVLKAHLNSVINCRHLKVGLGDQTLCLDTNSDEDIDLILDMLIKRKKLWVEEAQIPVTPVIVDHHRRPMLPQLVLTLCHCVEVYKPMRLPVSGSAVIDRKTWVAPGNEWLYFEIYVSPYQSDVVLNKKISRYLAENQQWISSWFFIRYTEDGEHIRLRLKLSDQQHGYSLMNRLSESLRGELDAGIISDVKLSVYRKEAHRYSARLIHQVEDHFHKDSQFVLTMLNAMLSDMAKYQLCVNVLEAITRTDIMSEEDFLIAGRQMESILSAEHKITIDGYKEINRLYRSFLKEDFPSLSEKAAELHRTMIASFIETIRQYEAEKRSQILSDLIHMHINRLFTKDQRLHELIIYNFFLTKEKSRRHSQRSEASGV